MNDADSIIPPATCPLLGPPGRRPETMRGAFRRPSASMNQVGPNCRPLDGCSWSVTGGCVEWKVERWLSGELAGRGC